MTKDTLQDEGTSPFTTANILLRSRWRVATWIGIGAAAAALSVAFSPTLFIASASFVPQGNEDGRSALVGLAGQLGVALPTSNPALSPDFYVNLLRSRELLSRIARDTFVVRELGDRRVPLLDLLKIKPGSEARRQDLGVQSLTELFRPTMDKKTGVVSVEVRTQWPSVSLNIVRALMVGVNEYNQQMRQTQATAERKFVEKRVAIARVHLRAAEDSLEDFLRANRQFATSVELTFEADRLKRNLSFHQQLSTSLNVSFEEALVREVRDTPVITMVEQPAARAESVSRGSLKRVVLGSIIGGSIGVFLVLVGGFIADTRQANDPDAVRFFSTLDEIKREMLRPFSRIRRRL